MTGTGTEDESPELQLRRELYEQLDRPITVRWLHGLRLRIYPDNEMSRVIYLTGRYEPNEFLWLSRVLAPGMTVIDVGANQGFYTLFAARQVGGRGRIIALEPSRREFDRLVENVRLNRLPNVSCLHLAAGAAPGSAILHVAAEFTAGHNTLGAFAYDTTRGLRDETVTMDTIDAVCAREEVERVDLIKMDIEGAELAALEGASRTIDAHRPAILIELCDPALERQGADSGRIWSFLGERGYRMLTFDADAADWRPATRAARYASENVMAMPPAGSDSLGAALGSAA